MSSIISLISPLNQLHSFCHRPANSRLDHSFLKPIASAAARGVATFQRTVASALSRHPVATETAGAPVRNGGSGGGGNRQAPARAPPKCSKVDPDKFLGGHFTAYNRDGTGAAPVPRLSTDPEDPAHEKLTPDKLRELWRKADAFPEGSKGRDWYMLYINHIVLESCDMGPVWGPGDPRWNPSPPPPPAPPTPPPRAPWDQRLRGEGRGASWSATWSAPVAGACASLSVVAAVAALRRHVGCVRFKVVPLPK